MRRKLMYLTAAALAAFLVVGVVADWPEASAVASADAEVLMETEIPPCYLYRNCGLCCAEYAEARCDGPCNPPYPPRSCAICVDAYFDLCFYSECVDRE